MAKKPIAGTIDPKRASSFSEVSANTGGNRDQGPDVSAGPKGGLKSGRVMTGKTSPKSARHMVGKKGRTF